MGLTDRKASGLSALNGPGVLPRSVVSAGSVEAGLAGAPDSGAVDDAGLPALLEQFDASEVLHVTFGSVLKDAPLRDRLLGLLREHPEIYAADLERHFLRHLEPFAHGEDS